MKILHIGAVSSNPQASGPSQSVSNLAICQAKIGMEVGLLSTSHSEKDALPRQLPGVCSVSNCCSGHRNPWKISSDVMELIRAEFGVPDLVNFHSTYIPSQVALSRRFRDLGRPYVITPRGGMTLSAQNFKSTKKRVSNWLFFNSYVKHAAAVHALCPREASQAEKLFKIRRTITVPNGVDDYLLEASGRLQPADLGDFSSDRGLLLGFIGRIAVYHKGLDLLLEAISILKKKSNRSNCRLFLVGPYDTKRDETLLQSTVRKHKLEDAVRVLEPQYNEEKWRHFLACDVFVHTSRFEGMPMSILEAMALSKPCLVTPGTNMSDIVVEGGGWECEPDPISIADTIETIQTLPRESITCAGRTSHNLVEKDFRWISVAERLKTEYATIIESSVC